LPALVVNDSTLLREIKEAEVNRAAIGKGTKARLTDLIENHEVVRGQLLLHMQEDPAATPQLTALLAEVFKSKEGPELMDMLLRRLEGREASVILPQFFRPRSVIRIIEVRPDLPVPEVRLPPPQVSEAEFKLGPSLRELLKDEKEAKNLH